MWIKTVLATAGLLAASGTGAAIVAAPALATPPPVYQACDPPVGIVVIESVYTPGGYPAEVDRLLDAHPGALWLRTDQSCPSLRQATETGDPIYAVYRVAGYTEADICAAVRTEGGRAYGKWLDTVHPPDYVVPCSATPAPVAPPPVNPPPVVVDTPYVPYIPAPSLNAPSGSCTWVDGYTRRDGTRVRGHWRGC